MDDAALPALVSHDLVHKLHAIVAQYLGNLVALEPGQQTTASSFLDNVKYCRNNISPAFWFEVV